MEFGVLFSHQQRTTADPVQSVKNLLLLEYEGFRSARCMVHPHCSQLVAPHFPLCGCHLMSFQRVAVILFITYYAETCIFLIESHSFSGTAGSSPLFLSLRYSECLY